MKKSLVIATISLLTMGSASVLASDLTIPNTFVSGTPAVAADVNANFDAIEDAVDDNDARITATEAAITTKANSADVYNKTQVDTALGVKADLVDVYTKTQVDLGLGTKANSADVYTKTQVDGSLATKANSADVYNKTQVDTSLGTKANSTDVYTKTQVDTSLATKANSADLYTQSQVNTLLSDKADTAAVTSLQTTVNGNIVDIADLQAGIPGATCLGNSPTDEMVRVGPLCVDKYEASVWSSSNGSGTQYGINSDDYPVSFPDSGNWTTTLYAVSKPSVIPSSYITWFQAQQSCAASGKRLLTNAEWQMAAAGTPDPGTGGTNAALTCNTNSLTNSKAQTGTGASGTLCISKWQVADMVGNVNEWVADWTPGGTHTTVANVALSTDGTSITSTTSVNSPNYASGNLGANYGNDFATSVQPAGNQGNGANFPAAIYRGGAYLGGDSAGIFAYSAASAPSDAQPNIGFRCAR